MRSTCHSWSNICHWSTTCHCGSSWGNTCHYWSAWSNTTITSVSKRRRQRVKNLRLIGAIPTRGRPKSLLLANVLLIIADGCRSGVIYT